MTLESIFIVVFMLAAFGLTTVLAGVWWVATRINGTDDKDHLGEEAGWISGQDWRQ